MQSRSDARELQEDPVIIEPPLVDYGDAPGSEELERPQLIQDLPQLS